MTAGKRKTAALDLQEISRQRQFCEKVKALLQTKYTQKPLAAVVTFGCQQNLADSEKIKGMLAEMGYGFTENRLEAQLIIFNTCAVREHAEARVFGNIGMLKAYKEENKDVVIACCGCMMQQEHIANKIKKSFPFVDLVFGTHVIHCLPQLLYSVLSEKKRVFETPDADGVIAEGVPVLHDSKTRAWLPIMYGCNNFCTYCIVPYVRGRERSRDKNVIIGEAKELVSMGCKEITLLGQNVNSYGKDLEPRVSFAQLLRELNEIDGDFRIRFMTSHPKDCTKELLQTMAGCGKVARHLHLPFQSGSNRVLKAMHRGYTREQYIELVNYARQLMGDDISITSDIIVGFPGETYEEFCETLSLVSEIKFSALFTFIYSPRKGTPAAEMPDLTPLDEKKKWFKELTDLQEKISDENMKKFRGKTFKSFVYGEGKLGAGYLAARTDGNLIIEFKGGRELIGTFQNIKATTPKTYVLVGEIESSD
ncbi:MAG: tRNA (N6-isopentenyl adenosine(37)-C2)-methylthiotransferase MiaB [Clostridiales bacterium]|nr:tRNA (N6-isopentenyl adenosine(37)-C2)-methylthiotransferase MiaB [Clostridiales bacterium]